MDVALQQCAVAISLSIVVQTTPVGHAQEPTGPDIVGRVGWVQQGHIGRYQVTILIKFVKRLPSSTVEIVMCIST